VEQPREILKQSALKYSKKGFKVMPLNGKLPLTKNGSKDATTDTAQIEAWWTTHPNANIGVATGDGLIVVDFDNLTGEAAELYASLPASWVSKTGRGYHIWLSTDMEISNSASRLAKGVDIRGEGGYIVVPPSIHPDGGHYTWHVYDADEPDEAPAWLTEKLLANKRVSHPALTTQDPIASGGRNEALAAIAGSMRHKGLSQAAIEAALLEENQLRCDPPLSDEEVMRVAKSVSRYEPATDVAKAPATTKAIESELTVEGLKADPQLAFRRDIVAYLSGLERSEEVADIGKWEAYKDMFRQANIGLRSVNAAMKAHAVKQRPVPKGNTIFDDQPILLAIPPNFRLRPEGVYKIAEEGMEERILHSPLLLTKRLKDTDTNEEQVEIQWRKDGQWQAHVCPRKLISTAQAITNLSDAGLPVTSNTASDVVKYLSELESSNLSEIPLEVCVTHTGWVGAERFVPGHEKGLVFTPSGYHLRHVFNPHGALDEWIRHISPYREAYPLFRYQLAMGFAASLLKPLNGRNFIMHSWGKSASGKSATMRAVVSVWASPALMVSFNSTPLAMNIHASMLNHMPVCINERQMGTRSLDKAIYSLAEGTAKMQGHKEGGLRHMSGWQSLILTNGEEPLTNSRGMQGTKSRVMEIEGSPITDEAKAAALYDITAEYYGTAGPEFVRRLIDLDPKELQADWEKMKAAMLEIAPLDVSRNHVTSAALLALADQYATLWLFGSVDKDEAYSEGWNMGAELVQDHLESGEEFDQAERTYSRVVSMVRNQIGITIGKYSTDETKLSHNGHIAGGRVYILKEAFDSWAENSRLSGTAMRRDLVDAGYMESTPDGKKRRLYVRKDGLQYCAITLPEDLNLG